MESNLYFNRDNNTIVAMASGLDNAGTSYRFESDNAFGAIDGLCNIVSKNHGNKIAGEILLYLRKLYYKIVNIVIREDKTGDPNIWAHDCNQYHNLLKIVV